jgi:hypothetical protein
VSDMYVCSILFWKILIGLSFCADSTDIEISLLMKLADIAVSTATASNYKDVCKPVLVYAIMPIFRAEHSHSKTVSQHRRIYPTMCNYYNRKIRMLNNHVNFYINR